MRAGRSGPLEDVRVVDMTRALSGPFATMILADLGADVVKVETPPWGDDVRSLGPYTEGDAERHFGGYFATNNRNKRSVLFDPAVPSQVDRLKELIAGADVLVENYRPGVMEERGLSYEVLQELNPRLVYGAIRGFGDPRTGESPCADWAAFDIVAQAMSGVISHTGTATGERVAVGPSIGDLVPGAMAVVGILGALHHARATGEGQFVDVGMVDCLVSLCEGMIWRYSYTGEVQGPHGSEHPLLAPFGVFATTDGGVAIAAPTASQWRELCSIIGREDLADDDRTRTTRRRAPNRKLVRDAIEVWTTRRSTSAAMGVLGGRVPAAPVNDAPALVADPHIRAREMLIAVDHPGSERPVLVPNTPIRFTRTPVGVYRRAPLLGEHTDEVLGSLWASERG